MWPMGILFKPSRTIKKSFVSFKGRDSSITQLSARCNDDVFNVYLTPLTKMSDEAVRVTGLHFYETTNIMTHHDKPVQHVHPMNALLDFMQFLMTIGKSITLIAHNNKRFDCIVLYNHLKYFNLWNHFCKLVSSFADTLPFFRKLYPEFPNHKQETLVENLLKETYSAHDAREDCFYLQKLVLHTGYIDMLLTEFMFKPGQIASSGVQPQEMSIEYLCHGNILSRCMATKLRDSSLTYEHLELAYERDGFDGLYYLLSEKDSMEKTRVTKSKNVIQKLVNHFHKLHN